MQPVFPLHLSGKKRDAGQESGALSIAFHGYSAVQSVSTYTVGWSKGSPIMAAACSL